jgi:hypothetical protein|tara:strand:- start:217 stop:450 length:234 start_codon:yes stop_codon:yes gene_type:complete
MPKYVIKEGVLDKLIQVVFKLAATGDERKAINTVLGKDKDFRKDMKDLAAMKKRIEKKIKEKEKDLPGLRKAINKYK